MDNAPERLRSIAAFLYDGTVASVEDGRFLDDLADTIQALTAEAARREGEIERLRRELQQKELIHIGYTNAHQIAYAKDESGSFYPDTENECYIPVYMLKNHKHRAVILDVDALTAGEGEDGNDQ